MERPINQRIKFLLESLQLSARDFSRALGVADNNTQNYLEPRFAQPKADYLEKIMLHFESINPSWLLTGRGEPFYPTDPTQVKETNATYATDKNFSNSQVIKGKGNTQQQGKRNAFISHSHSDVAHLQQLVEQLRSQLTDKDAVIAAKEETIQLLKAAARHT